MPDGTVSQETYTRELKSLPPDGFVELKMLPYHDMLVRRDKGSIASMEQTQQRRGKKGEREPETQKLMIESLQTWERDYMFRNCIVNHNITDKNGVPLDFNSSMAFKMLRPDVGMEIERYIDELHSEDEIDENFQTVPTSSTEPPGQEPLHLAHTDTPTN